MLTRDQLLKRVEIDSTRGGGRPRISGTRIDVGIVLDALAEGLTPLQVMEEYPALSLEDIQASMAYAAELARDDVIKIPIP